MVQAWYSPPAFTPIPVGGSSGSRQDDEDPEEEVDDGSEDEIFNSVEYLCSLIDEEVEKGINVKRIVIGGFSQGCAVSLVAGLASGRYKGQIGGVVGLSGYFPKGRKIQAGRKEYGKEGVIKVFLAHGTRDMLVPVGRDFL